VSFDILVDEWKELKKKPSG